MRSPTRSLPSSSAAPTGYAPWPNEWLSEKVHANMPKELLDQARWPSSCRRTQAAAAASRDGSSTSPRPIGGIPEGPTARLTAAKTTLWSTSPTRMPWPMPGARRVASPLRNNRNTPRGAVGTVKTTGERFDPNDKPIANTWQGIFPVLDTKDDGYAGTALSDASGRTATASMT